MKRLSIIFTTATALAAAMIVIAQERKANVPATTATHSTTAPADSQPGPASRFTFVDVMIDPKGAGLAAWQVEFAAEAGKVTLVGVEQGEHAAFAKRPPYYDPAALAGNRIIVGDFSLDENLPKAKTRVARLMLEVRGPEKPLYVTKLMAAAGADGKQIAADVTLAGDGTADNRR